MKYLFIHYYIIEDVISKLREYIFHLYKYKDYSIDNTEMKRTRNRKINQWCGQHNQRYNTKNKKKGDSNDCKMLQYCWWSRSGYELKGELICGFIVWMELKYPEIKIMYDEEELLGHTTDKKIYLDGLQNFINQKLKKWKIDIDEVKYGIDLPKPQSIIAIEEQNAVLSKEYDKNKIKIRKNKRKIEEIDKAIRKDFVDKCRLKYEVKSNIETHLLLETAYFNIQNYE